MKHRNDDGLIFALLLGLALLLVAGEAWLWWWRVTVLPHFLPWLGGGLAATGLALMLRACWHWWCEWHSGGRNGRKRGG